MQKKNSSIWSGKMHPGAVKKQERKKMLNKILDHMNDEKGHSEEERNKLEISGFIDNFNSIILGTVSPEGNPIVGYAPFFRYQGDNYIFINETEEYFTSLKNNRKVTLLFIEDESSAVMVSMRKRLTYKVKIEFVEKGKGYEEILDNFQKVDMAIQMTRNIPVFHLLKVKFLNGRYINGPRTAFDISEDRKVTEVQLGAVGHPSEKQDENITEDEEKGNFTKRFKSHADSSGLVSNYFRKNKKMITETELFKLLENPAKEKEGVIYVHVPYCDKICSFCNLNRKKLDNDLEDYTNFLVSEFEKYGKTPYMKSKEIKVVFFGGGTPTILKEHQLEKIFRSIHENYNLSDDYEFTLETTLHNLNLNKIKILEKYGVNRLSVGIQSFAEKGRNMLNRTFTKEEAIRRLKELKENFSGMVCTDIIYNYPEETVEEVMEDAKIVADLEIDSTSFYSLMIHEGSKMSKDIKENTFELNYQLETDRKLHHAFLEKLLATGEYEVMEHTKVVRKGKDRYNYIRFTHKGADILPIGVGAGGKIADTDIFRINNEKAFYMLSENTEEENRFKRISGLFQYPEVYFTDLKKYVSEEVFEGLYKLFKNFEAKGYMKVYDTHTELTTEGIFWGNNISSVILKKCLGGNRNEKAGNIFHIDGKYRKNS
jgi:putative coproporphyrinogen dehydrogenase